MKRSSVIASILVFFACISTFCWVYAQEGVSIELDNIPVEKVLECYRDIVKCELVVASNVKNASGRVTVQRHRDLSVVGFARLLEKALLEQAGVIITALDGKSISVTYNDQILVPLASPK